MRQVCTLYEKFYKFSKWHTAFLKFEVLFLLKVVIVWKKTKLNELPFSQTNSLVFPGIISDIPGFSRFLAFPPYFPGFPGTLLHIPRLFQVFPGFSRRWPPWYCMPLIFSKKGPIDCTSQIPGAWASCKYQRIGIFRPTLDSCATWNTN